MSGKTERDLGFQREDSYFFPTFFCNLPQFLIHFLLISQIILSFVINFRMNIFVVHAIGFLKAFNPALVEYFIILRIVDSSFMILQMARSCACVVTF